MSATHKDFRIDEEHLVLVTFDTFEGHKGKEMDSLLMKNNNTDNSYEDPFQYWDKLALPMLLHTVHAPVMTIIALFHSLSHI